MPIDAVWLMATVPQKNFERTLITFNRKIENVVGNEKFLDDYYEEQNEKKPYMERVSSCTIPLCFFTEYFPRSWRMGSNI